MTTDQAELAVLAQKGNEAAKTALVRMNEKFVIMIARQYIGQGMDLDDMIQEGNIGLLKAIDMYDAQLGTKFLTYASWWIKQSILQALAEHNRQIRLPVNRIGVLEKYKKIKSSLTQELMREPSKEEILEALGIDESELYEQTSVSYNTPINGVDGEGSMLDLIANDTPSPDSELIKDSLKKELRLVLKNLTDREQQILKLSYGLDEERSYTLEEIGERLNLTRERVRQIKEKALRNLRRLNRKKKLEGLKN